MAGISEFLNIIKNNRYGKDIRMAIHDAIQQCYTDAAGELKVDKNQGKANAGKILGIGNDGAVKPVEQFSVAAKSINTEKLADHAVTEEKLADAVNKKIDQSISDVNELKDDLSEFVGFHRIQYIEHFYIDLSGSKADIDNPIPYQIHMYAVVPCVESDKFLINGRGGSAPRVWGFVDSDHNIISVAGANIGANNLELTAPKNSAFLVVHNANYTDTPLSYVGIPTSANDLKERISENKQEIISVRSDVDGIIKETVTTGINVFDYSKVELYKQVDISTGKIVDTTSTSGVCMKSIVVPKGNTTIVSVYKKTDGSEMITAQSGVIYHFYNDGIYLGRDIGGKVVNIPSDANIILIQTESAYSNVLKNIMVAFADHQIPYEEFEEIVKESRLDSIEDKVRNMVTQDGVDQITKENASFIDKSASKNVFDKNKATIGYTVNTDGGIIANTNRAVSDFISCDGENVFSVSTGGEGVYAFYDKNKAFISPYKVFTNTGLVNLSIPSNAKYLRVSLTKSSINTFMVVFASEVGTYEKYDTIYKLSEDVNVKIADKTPKGIIDSILASGGQIKFIGDSITHGVGGTGFEQDGQAIVPDSETYHVNTNGYCHVNLFKKYISAKYGNTVLNFGTRGVRSYNIKSFLQKDGYVTDDDKLIICMIGTNNKWATESSTIEDFKKDLQYIIDWCAERDKKLIFVSAPMSTVQYDTTYSDGSLVKFHNEDIDHAYKEICYKNGMGYIPMYQRMVEYCDLKDIEINTIFNDGLHPNDKGYYIMYKLLMRELGLAYQLPNSSWDDASPTA